MKFSESTDSHLIDDLKKENENLRRQLEVLKTRCNLLKTKHADNEDRNPCTDRKSTRLNSSHIDRID
jgi:hypothetical protein